LPINKMDEIDPDLRQYFIEEVIGLLVQAKEQPGNLTDKRNWFDEQLSIVPYPFGEQHFTEDRQHQWAHLTERYHASINNLRLCANTITTDTAGLFNRNLVKSNNDFRVALQRRRDAFMAHNGGLPTGHNGGLPTGHNGGLPTGHNGGLPTGHNGGLQAMPLLEQIEPQQPQEPSFSDEAIQQLILEVQQLRITMVEVQHQVVEVQQHVVTMVATQLQLQDGGGGSSTTMVVTPAPAPAAGTISSRSRSRLILRAGGEREILLEAEEAATIANRFATELAENVGASVHAIDLSGRSWSDGAIDAILPFLRSVSRDVKILNLDDCIAIRATEVGLSVMGKLANAFRESNLIQISLNSNAMGLRGLVRVQPLFEGSNLQQLYLINNGLSAEAMKILNQIVLADNGRIAKSLTVLQLDRSMCGKEGAELVGAFVSECTKLTKFTYVGCRPEPVGTLAICEGLFAMTEKTENPVLWHLDLEDCTIGSGVDDAVEPLSKALSKCRQLCYLNMGSGDLENEGLQRVVAALMESQARLTHLFLGM
jgi:hypothetical protein